MDASMFCLFVFHPLLKESSVQLFIKYSEVLYNRRKIHFAVINFYNLRISFSLCVQCYVLSTS